MNTKDDNNHGTCVITQGHVAMASKRALVHPPLGPPSMQRLTDSLLPQISYRGGFCLHNMNPPSSLQKLCQVT